MEGETVCIHRTEKISATDSVTAEYFKYYILPLYNFIKYIDTFLLGATGTYSWVKRYPGDDYYEQRLQWE